jgi:hypothetical protein
MHAQQAKDLSPGIAWQVRGLWQVDGQGAPILTGDPIQPGSLLQPGEGTTGDSITLLLPDGQRILYECFKPEDCERGFRVPSLYRTPTPFGVEMLAHIRSAVVAAREKPLMVEPAPPLPRDEAVTMLSSDKKVRIEGLITRLPAGRYTYDLHPLDGRSPKQFQLPFEKTDSPVTLPLPSAGLYQVIVVDELNSQRIDLVVAAVTPEQAAIGQSFHQAKQLMMEWADFYYGWPIHDFLRAYLESLMLVAKPGQPVDSAKASPPKASISGQSAKGEAYSLATAEPNFLPAPGVFKSAIEVSLKCDTPGATMHYTVDGAQPMNQSAIYHAPIVVQGSELTIKSFASAPGKKDSPVVTGIFRIEK